MRVVLHNSVVMTLLVFSVSTSMLFGIGKAEEQLYSDFVDQLEELQSIDTLAVPSTLEERFSYTYGYLLMETAKRDINALDVAYFARGVLDSGLMEGSLINPTTMNAILFEYQDQLIKEATLRLQQLAQSNLEQAEAFLKDNAKRDSVITTSSGLQYEIMQTGEGKRVEEGQSVQVHYRLSFLDGREGSSSVGGGVSTFEVATLLPGFKEAMSLMNKGSRFRFYIHPSLAYGDGGTSSIEPNSLLVIEVELVDIL
ncbi:MAG: FKBP-type peptidyl-prolyl cis-trans isomerase N-terminal domain-containing protein [Sphaerochaetaceae bacterium]|jgi:FKBP-type peptidyl-prolyl cis-trans isomerase FkpA